LRAAVFHDRAEIAECGLFQKVCVFFGDILCHGYLLMMPLVVAERSNSIMRAVACAA
jgi:hypothetical protein